LLAPSEWVQVFCDESRSTSLPRERGAKVKRGNIAQDVAMRCSATAVGTKKRLAG
jgi:hypothetical protein